MNTIYIKFLTILSVVSLSLLNAQTQYASDVVVLNGESFGANASNIGIYNIASKTYEVIDTMGTNSVQAVIVEDGIAYVAAQTKILSYDLDSKTKIAEVDFPGTSPNRNAISTDNDNIYVGNWYGQSDSNFYAFDKTTLAFKYAVAEATTECGGSTSLNDTLYIGQKLKETVASGPWGNFLDSLGSIILANPLTGAYYRTIELGVAGTGISSIYSEGNYIFAMNSNLNKILKIEIGTDVVTEIPLAPFTKVIEKIGTKVYLDMNGKAGYYDLANGSIAISALAISGTALAYDPNTETGFSTSTDYATFGKLNVFNTTMTDTTSIGISPEVIALVFKTNYAPVTEDDNYEFTYEENISEYTLDVLENDSDADGDVLTITSISTPSISGATAIVDGQNIKYIRATGIASSDYFTYTACDAAGACSTSIVHVTMTSTVGIKTLNSANQITISPNPSSRIISINTNEFTFEKVVIKDALGQTVKISKKAIINLESIVKGVYFAQVYTTKQNFVVKFIVE